MNNRRHCAVALVVIVFGMWGAGARAQTTKVAGVVAPVTLPPTVYTSPGANAAAIDNFVKLNVQNLLNDTDPSGQGKARDVLVLATQQGGGPASPEFLFEYGRAINNALAPKLAGANANQLSLRQRMNMAILVAKVAYIAQNATLQQTTLKLLSDPTEPVVLWGLKAAQAQLPQVLQMKAPGGKLPPLVAESVAAVLKFPSGPVFDEGYHVLDAPDPDVAAKLLELWGVRLSQYQGKDAPDDPAVDGRPVFQLTQAATWKVLTPKQKDAVMQNISDQLSAAAQWADQTPAGDKHDQLVKLIQQCGGGCWVLARTLNLKPLEQAALPVTNLRVETTPASLKMVPAVAPLLAAIKEAFPNVQPAPQVGPNANVARP